MQLLAVLQVFFSSFCSVSNKLLTQWSALGVQGCMMAPRLFVWTLLRYIGREGKKKKEKALLVGKKNRKLRYEFGMSQQQANLFDKDGIILLFLSLKGIM